MRDWDGEGGETNLKDVVDKGVEDRHGLVGDTGVGVDLLEDLVDVGRVRFDSLLVALLLVGLVALGLGGLSGRLLGGGLGGSCRRRQRKERCQRGGGEAGEDASERATAKEAEEWTDELWKRAPWKQEPWRQEPSGRWSARTEEERRKVSKALVREEKEGSSTYRSGLGGHVEVVKTGWVDWGVRK
jgi:hypothetical protein